MTTFYRAAPGFAGLLLFVTAPSAVESRFDEKAAVVTVVAESAAPIRNLTAKDFVVKEGGKKLDVTDAHLSTDPLSVSLLVDIVQPRGTTATRELRTAPAAFVRAVLETNPDARIALWQVANSPTLSVDFSSKADDLNAAIARLYPSTETGTALLDAIDTGARPLANRPGSRRAIVSVDFNTPEASPASVLQKAADAIANSGASLWAVSVRGVAPSSPLRDELLEKMSKGTGGKLIVTIDPSGLEGALLKVAASLTSQYLVTFTRAGDGALKPLTFETTRGAKVLATPFMR